MKRATINDAPKALNINDRAMWVLGFNAALDAAQVPAPALLQRIEQIAGDFVPDHERDAPQALQEMRDALLAALELHRAAHGVAPSLAGGLPSVEADGPEFDSLFRQNIDFYADQHRSLLVRQLARRLRAAWAAAGVEGLPE